MVERARRELDLEVVRGGNERVSRVAGSGLDARRRDLGVVSRYLERDARGKWSRQRGERQRGSVDRINSQHQIETSDRDDGADDFEHVQLLDRAKFDHLTLEYAVSFLKVDVEPLLDPLEGLGSFRATVP